MKVLVSPEFVVVFFLISWFALGPLPTQAALRYVDPDGGSDARGDATKENPVKTIDRALDFAKSGDTLYLESGSYKNIDLTKSLGIWGNPENKPTIQGPITFGSQVTALVDLYYRDFVLTGSQGITFDKSVAVDGVTFERLELQISGSDVFFGGKGQLNITGDGLIFNNLKISQSGSGSGKAVDISVSSGPVIFANLTVKGNNKGLEFNIAKTPRNVQITNVTLSDKVQFSVSDPQGISVTKSSFTGSMLSITGGYGAIQFTNFSSLSDGAAIELLSPTTANNRFTYDILNNTFTSISSVLDISAVDDSSPLQVGFGNNLFVDGKVDVAAITLGEVDSISIDARNNWWGDDSGPKDIFCNPEGRGAEIVLSNPEVGQNILYRPWCSTADCSVLKTVRSACAAGDDPSGFIEDDADSMTPWGMSILIIAVCSVSYLVFLMIFFFAVKIRQSSASRDATDQEKLT